MLCGMSADARIQARDYYLAAGRDMEEDLAALAAHPQGVLLFTPHLVAMLKPVCSKSVEHWPQLQHIFPQADGWYIHLLVGNLRMARHMAAALPPLQWLCFQRGLRNTTPHRLPWHAFIHH